MWSIETSSGSWDAVNLKSAAKQIANYVLGDSPEDDSAEPSTLQLIYCTGDRDIIAPAKVLNSFQDRLLEEIKFARESRDGESAYQEECRRLVYDKM